MTNTELIQILQKFPADTPVFIIKEIAVMSEIKDVRFQEWTTSPCKQIYLHSA